MAQGQGRWTRLPVSPSAHWPCSQLPFYASFLLRTLLHCRWWGPGQVSESGAQFLLAGPSVLPSQAGPALSRIRRPPRRPSLDSAGARPATTSPEEVTEVLAQPPRPQLRPGRLQQLRAALSQRLGSLDPSWLRRCDIGTPGLLETPEASQPVVGAEQPPCLTAGGPSVLGPSTGLEAPSQGPGALESVQGAAVSAGRSRPGTSQAKRRRQSRDPAGSPAQAQEDSGQAEPLPTGAGEAALVEDCPGVPVQAQPPCGPAAPRYHSLSLPATWP